MVGERAVGPPVILLEYDGRRSGPPFVTTKAVVGGGGPERDGTHAPDEFALLLGNEEASRDVAHAAPTTRSRKIVLIHDGNDGCV